MANKEPIRNFVLHDRHGHEIDFSSFAVVGEVEVTLGDGIGEPTAESTYEGGKLIIDIDNIKGDGITNIEQTPSTEDAGINIVTITCESGATYQLQILNGSRGNGITAIETIVAEGDGEENIVRIKTNDNQEGITFKVKNGTKGSQGPQGPQGESVIAGEGDLPLDHVLGYDSTKAMSQRGIADGVESVKVGREQFVGYVAGEYVDNSNGNITPYSGRSRTNFLSVEGISTLTIENAATAQTTFNVFYDANRNYLARFTINAGTNNIAVPEWARWCVISARTENINKISISNLPPIVGVDTKINGLQSSIDKVFIERTIYGGNINAGVWTGVGSAIQKYRIIRLPNASGNITFKAKAGLSTGVQCLSQHNPVEGTSNGILSNFANVQNGASRTYQIPEGTNYLWVYWSTSGHDRSPESIMYNGIDLMGDLTEVAKECLNIAHITQMESMSNDYVIGHADTMEGIADLVSWVYNPDVAGTRIYFTMNVMFSSNMRITANSGYKVGYTLYAHDGSVLYESAWLNSFDLTGTLSTYQTVARITIVFQKGSNEATNLEDIIANAVASMSVDYVVTKWNEYPDLTIFNNIQKEIQELKGDSTGILDFNTPKEIKPKLSNLARCYVRYGHSRSEYTPVLAFIHISDVHASNINILRVKEFYDEYQSYINGGVIDTGDWIGQNLANGLPSATDSVPEFIRILGNHDAYYYPDGHWELAPQTDCYNAFLKDYIENWGVVQPEGAEANGYCYFYKDYTANNVRLICLDGEHLRSGDNLDATQLAWFQDTLASAKTGGLHVVVAIHRAPFALVPMPENPFDNIDFPNKSLAPYGGDHQPYTEAYMAVKSFIDAGGVFVCWLCGHSHDDYFGIGNNADTANQLVIGVACAASNAAATDGTTIARDSGQKSQDCFNVVGIDTNSKTIKLLRIGADYDRYMRKKNTLSWNYATSQMIYID